MERSADRKVNPRCSFSSAAHQKISCYKLSHSFRKCSASTNAVTIIFCKSPMRGPTLVDFPVQHLVKQCRGEKSIPIAYLMQLCVMWILLWRFRSLPLMLLRVMNHVSRSAC